MLVHTFFLAVKSYLETNGLCYCFQSAPWQIAMLKCLDIADLRVSPDPESLADSQYCLFFFVTHYYVKIGAEFWVEGEQNAMIDHQNVKELLDPIWLAIELVRIPCPADREWELFM
jgi:hypothetical protein